MPFPSEIFLRLTPLALSTVDTRAKASLTASALPTRRHGQGDQFETFIAGSGSFRIHRPLEGFSYQIVKNIRMVKRLT